MKKIILLFSFIIISFISKSQDYFPMKLGNYWVYDIIDTNTNLTIGRDSTFLHRFFINGTDTVYTFKRMYHLYSGTDLIDSLRLYNNFSNKNNIIIYPSNAKFFQHNYSNGDTWGIGLCPGTFCYDVTANSIGNVTVPIGSFNNCYIIVNELYEDITFAPNIGPIKFSEGSKDSRRLIKYGNYLTVKNTDILIKTINKLFPNPNNGNFILETNEIGIVELYDISGKHIQNISIESNETNINLDLKPGSYILKFNNYSKILLIQ